MDRRARRGAVLRPVADHRLRVHDALSARRGTAARENVQPVHRAGVVRQPRLWRQRPCREIYVNTYLRNLI